MLQANAAPAPVLVLFGEFEGLREELDAASIVLHPDAIGPTTERVEGTLRAQPEALPDLAR